MTRHPNRFTMLALSALLAAAHTAQAADAASGTDALPAPGPAHCKDRGSNSNHWSAATVVT